MENPLEVAWEAILDFVFDYKPRRQSDYMLQPAAPAPVEIDDPIIECCLVCGNDIKTMTFKGTGVCGIVHQKILDDERPRGGGWHHTCAKNLDRHLMHRVKFSLPDPLFVYEGTVGQVVWGEGDKYVSLTLEPGYTCYNAYQRQQNPDMELVPVEDFFQTELGIYKVVEVLSCR